MKSPIAVLCLLWSLAISQAQTFTLSVQNGYGSGQYAAGDTVHIWAQEDPSGDVFYTWNGDYNLLDYRQNWHTTLVMPARNVTVSAQFESLPAGITANSEMIPVPGHQVQVTYALPPNMKGAVWLFNGKNGRGSAWFDNKEKLDYVRALLLRQYGVIAMDSEEVSLQNDLDNSGEFAFYLTPDTLNNKDLVNVRAVRDHLEDRGLLPTGTVYAASGFSSGAAFSEVLAAALGWRASLSHNTPGIDYIVQNAFTPHYQNNAVNDNGPNVGEEGNVSAYADYLTYQNRGVCSKWILQEEQPIYPERFARVEGISVERSRLLFTAMKAAGLLTSDNYQKNTPSDIEAQYEANPAAFASVFQGLSAAQISQMFDQLGAAYAVHAFRSDYNGTAIQFLDKLCNPQTSYKLTVQNG